jgi:DNA-binding transcriptional LysR family regulator
MRHATLRQLKVFVSAARHLSFARAAAELHLTPPAVSIQIAQLERDVGQPLFDRIGRRLHLTQAGAALLRSATAVLAQLHAASEELAALRGVEGGVLNVGVISAGDYFFPTLLAQFCARHRAVHVGLGVCNRDELIRRLDHNMVDLAVMSEPPDGPEFAAAPFAAHPIVVIAAPEHPLARARRVPLAAIAREPLIAREPGSLTRKVMDETLRRARHKAGIAIEAPSNETIKQAVAVGFGVAFMSAHAIALEVEHKRLAVLDVIDFPVRRRWYTVFRRGKHLPPVAKAFAEFLASHGEAAIRRLVPPKLRALWGD